MPILTLKNLKDDYDQMCKREYKDKTRFYNFNENIFKNYNSRLHYLREHPYPDLNNCKKFDIHNVKHNNVIYKNITECDKCKLLKGYCAETNSKNYCFLHEKDYLCFLNKDKDNCGYFQYLDDKFYISLDSLEKKKKLLKLPISWPTIFTKNFQSYLYDYFNNLFLETPLQYNKLNNENNCVANDNKMLLKSQSVIYSIFRGMATEENSEQRGLLIWHSTGSGKTCTAAGIMDAFWDVDNYNIVFVTSIEALASNNIETFAKCLKSYYLKFKSLSLEEVIKKINKRNIKFFTFAQLSHYLLLHNPLKIKEEDKDKHLYFLKNAVLIIDEAHNLLHPLPQQKKEHESIVNFLLNKNQYNTKLKIAILTATPGKTERDLVLLLNLIKPYNNPFITVPNINNDKEVQKFISNTVGLVSYFNFSSNKTIFPETKEYIYNAPMSMELYKLYAEAVIKNRKNPKLTIEDTKFYLQPRKYSNSLFNYTYKDFSSDYIKIFSNKTYILLKNLEQYEKGKHYIYSTFFHKFGFGGQGIIMIAKILNQRGYIEATSFNESIFRKKQKRYILCIKSKFPNKEQVAQAMKIYNDERNKYGEYISLFLASQNFNEGLDFKDLQHIHIMEPFLNTDSYIQTIGRAVRYCSHKNLSQNKWLVRIHKYIADYPITTIFNEENINNIKNKIQEIKNNTKDVKKLKKELHTLLQIHPKNIEMIEKDIIKLSQENTKIRNFLFKILKQNAVDAKLYIS
jgi:superfamily II DNA or RNA helicase